MKGPGEFPTSLLDTQLFKSDIFLLKKSISGPRVSRFFCPVAELYKGQRLQFCLIVCVKPSERSLVWYEELLWRIPFACLWWSVIKLSPRRRLFYGGHQWLASSLLSFICFSVTSKDHWLAGLSWASFASLQVSLSLRNYGVHQWLDGLCRDPFRLSISNKTSWGEYLVDLFVWLVSAELYLFFYLTQKIFSCENLMMAWSSCFTNYDCCLKIISFKCSFCKKDTSSSHT